jgi:hypothetical protein
LKALPEKEILRDFALTTYIKRESMSQNDEY